MTAAGSSGGGAIEVKCKRWSCELCEPHRRGGVIRQILNGNPNKMLTLTMQPRPSWRPDAMARAITEAFPKFMREVRKRLNHAEMAYFAVFEAHVSGQPHLHVALRCPYIHWKILRAIWKKLTGSFIVDIRAVDDKNRTAGYMSKYLGKDLHKFGTLKRYWQSKNWQTEEQKVLERTFPPSWKWERDDRPMPEVKAEWISRGRQPWVPAPGMLAWGSWIPQIEAYGAATPVERREMRQPRAPPLRYVGGFLKRVSKAGVAPVEVANAGI